MYGIMIQLIKTGIPHVTYSRDDVISISSLEFAVSSSFSFSMYRYMFSLNILFLFDGTQQNTVRNETIYSLHVRIFLTKWKKLLKGEKLI